MPSGWPPRLSSLSGLIRAAPGQALARAHVLVASGEVAEDALGRLRAGPEVAARTRGLSDLLTTPTEAPALVLAAVVHAEIATIAPFGSGDGLIARAVERMVLMSAGVDPQGVLPVEAGHLRLAPGYERALRGYATGSVAGVRGWLLHCAAAVRRRPGSESGLDDFRGCRERVRPRFPTMVDFRGVR